MPLATEKPERKPRRGPAWICIPLVLVVLALLLPAFLLDRPTGLAGHVVWVATPARPGDPNGPYHLDRPAPAVSTVGALFDGRSYRVDGATHARGFCLNGRAYYITWFKGERVH